MKEHFQDYGVRKWAGDDLIELQSEPLAALQTLVAPYAPCIVSGCEVTPDGQDHYTIAPGLVALPGQDAKGKACVKLVHYEGAAGTGNGQCHYLTLKCDTLSRTYMDGKSKAIAYNYLAADTTTEPQDVPCLTIKAEGGPRLIDTLGITQKLDRDGGDAKAVKVTFNEAAARELPESGNRLGTIVGSVRKWFSDLRALAFKDKVALADLDTDTAEALNSKVDKVDDKGLSTEDFTSALKDKLTKFNHEAGGDLSGSYPNPTIKDSVNLSGDPTAKTQAASDNSDKIATTKHVKDTLANYVPLSAIGQTVNSIPKIIRFPRYQEIVDMGFNVAATAISNYEYFRGLCMWAAQNLGVGSEPVELIGIAAPNSLCNTSLCIYKADDGLINSEGYPRWCLGHYSTLSGELYTFGFVEHKYYHRRMALDAEVAKPASDNNFITRGDEFNFANDTVGQIHVNFRRGTGQLIGGITDYRFEDGGGEAGLAGVTAKSFTDSSGYVYSPKNRPPALGGFGDRRSVVEKPDDYNSCFAAKGIKNVSTYNLPAESGTQYAQVLGYRGWSDSSGGNAHEFALTGDNGGRMFHRTGATTAWGAWREVAHMDDLTPSKLRVPAVVAAGTMDSDGSMRWFVGKAGSASRKAQGVYKISTQYGSLHGIVSVVPITQSEDYRAFCTKSGPNITIRIVDGNNSPVDCGFYYTYLSYSDTALP